MRSVTQEGGGDLGRDYQHRERLRNVDDNTDNQSRRSVGRSGQRREGEPPIGSDYKPNADPNPVEDAWHSPRAAWQSGILEPLFGNASDDQEVSLRRRGRRFRFLT